MIFQILKFGSVGLVNTAVDFAILNFLVQIVHLPLLLSNTISFSAAVINSFFWNKYWTFDKRDTHWRSEILKFIITALIGLILSNLFVYIFTHLTPLHYNVAKLISALIVFIWNFSASKWLVFK